jgi:hypothetical protein
MPFCALCDAELAADLRIGRESTCPHCDGYLHACIQCRFYEPTLHNQCLEPEADYVGDRQKANFCEFFQLAGTRGSSKSDSGRADPARGRPRKPSGDARPSDARPSDARASDARARFDALFKKLDDEEE